MTGPTEVRLEKLLGRRVIGPGGALDRIVDVQVEPHGEEYVVTGFVLCSASFRSRISSLLWTIPTFRALGLGRRARHHVVSWDRIDLTDPAHPHLRTSS